MVKKILNNFSRRKSRKAYYTVIVRYSLVWIIIMMVFNLLLSYQTSIPKTREIIEENEELIEKISGLNSYINEVSKQIDLINRRDNASYRTVLGIEPHKSEYNVNDVDVNIDLVSDRYTHLINDTWVNIYKAKYALYNSTASLDTIGVMASEYEKYSRCIPAIWPVDISGFQNSISPFGPRFHPVLKKNLMHHGLDLSCYKNTPVISTADGIVQITRDGWNGGYGNEVVIDHGLGFKTRYAHLNKILVKKGDIVRRGDKIGLVGSTGRSTGDHLHYEVIHRNKKVDPANYFTHKQSREDAAKLLESARIEVLEDVRATNPNENE